MGETLAKARRAQRKRKENGGSTMKCAFSLLSTSVPRYLRNSLFNFQFFSPLCAFLLPDSSPLCLLCVLYG